MDFLVWEVSSTNAFGIRYSGTNDNHPWHRGQANDQNLLDQRSTDEL